MAEIEKKNEWGAGLLAITATLFIGAAIPIILYFVVYKPQVQRKEDQKTRAVQLDVQLNEQIERGKKLGDLQAQGEQVADELTKLESRFTKGDTEIAVAKILDLLKANNLGRTPDAIVRREKDAIRRTDIREPFPNGLNAGMVTISCFGKWQDFVTFVAAAESEGTATFVFGELYAEGDRNGKDNHTFLVDVWILLGRNIDAIGRTPVAPPK